MVRKHHGDSDHERNDTFHQAFRGNFSSLLNAGNSKSAAARLRHEPDSAATDREPASVACQPPTLVADLLT
jgi:hypothetical protein